MIKCLALDLDGTLLQDDGTLSGYTRNALEQAIKAGMHVVVASGRAFSTLPESVTQISGVEYAITSNGAAIYSVPGRKCLQVWKLKAEAVKHIVEIIHALQREQGWDNIAFEAFIDGVAFAEADYTIHPEKYGASQAAFEYVKKTRKPIPNIADFMIEHCHELDSIDVIVPTKEMKKIIWERLLQEESRIYITSSVAQLIEISDQKAGKHSGLRYVLEQLNLQPEHAAAFGNADNDADMLSFAGLGVAVENASRLCIQKADRVTLSNNEDGVAKVIEELAALVFQEKYEENSDGQTLNFG